MTIAPRFMGELPARAGSDAIHRPIRRAFLNKTQPHQAVTRSVPDWSSWRDHRNINGLAVPFLNPVPGILRSCFLRSWSGIPGFQNRDFLPNTLNYRANSDRPPFLVPDLRSWKKVNEINGVGCRGLLYIHIWVCFRNTHPYWSGGFRPEPDTAPHPPILDDGEAATPPPRCMAFAATDGAARRSPHTNPSPSQRKDTASQDLNRETGGGGVPGSSPPPP